MRSPRTIAHALCGAGPRRYHRALELKPASTIHKMSSPEAIAPQIAPSPRRVLIVLLGAIGDVVRALPLLGRIRNAWPDAHIAWAVEPKSKAVLEHHRWLDEIIVYDRAHAPWTFLPFLLASSQRPFRPGHRSSASSQERLHLANLGRARSFRFRRAEHQGVQPSVFESSDRAAAEHAPEAHAVPGVWRRARTCAIADRIWTRRDRRRTRPRARDARATRRALSWP